MHASFDIFDLLACLDVALPLPRGGAILGTSCMGVYLAMCLCNGLDWPYVCVKVMHVCSHYAVHGALVFPLLSAFILYSFPICVDVTAFFGN